MSEYYYYSGSDRVGPVTLSDLVSLPELAADTLVWHEGLSEWTHAVELPELSSLFAAAAADVADDVVSEFAPLSESKPVMSQKRVYIVIGIVLVIGIVIGAIVMLKPVREAGLDLPVPARLEPKAVVEESPSVVKSPSKREDLLKYINVSEMISLMEGVSRSSIAEGQLEYPGGPDDFWSVVRRRVNDGEYLRNLCISSYDKHFTHDEIKLLISHHEIGEPELAEGLLGKVEKVRRELERQIRSRAKGVIESELNRY